jgi:hypothetical protein
MRRILICCFLLAVTAAVPANAPAYYQVSHSHHSLESAFHRMDVNHDGLLTMREFVAHHKKKMGVPGAIAHYKALAARGGITRRNGVTGMTLHQFKMAHGVGR